MPHWFSKAFDCTKSKSVFRYKLYNLSTILSTNQDFLCILLQIEFLAKDPADNTTGHF